MLYNIFTDKNVLSKGMGAVYEIILYVLHIGKVPATKLVKL